MGDFALQTGHWLLRFIFLYPLFMSYLWMIGALLFRLQHERGARHYSQPDRNVFTPPVSVLIPCYNEGDNAEETLNQALALDYPGFRSHRHQ